MEQIQRNKSNAGAAAQQWRQHMDAWPRSGLTQRAYCQTHQLSRYAFQYWRKRLNGCPVEQRRLVEVSLPLPAGQAAIEIQIGERFRLHVPEGIRSEHLKTVLSVVAEL